MINRYRQIVKLLVSRVLEGEQTRRIVRSHIPVHSTDAIRHLRIREPDRVANLRSTRLRSDPIFITSRFRSGSTALWNSFRQIESCTAYYEPFNERKFFNNSAQNKAVDATHIGVQEYCSEYEGLEYLDELYDEDWCRHDLFMDAGDWNPNMQRFIEALIEAAPGRPVLQFNRIDFRLPWLRARFPNATILHLQREPRDQWLSTLINPTCYGPHTPANSLPDPFYQQMWAEDLQHVLPYLANPEPIHPYRLHYLLWKSSLIVAKSYAHINLDYSSLLAHPESVFGSLADELELPPTSAAKMSSILTNLRAPSWPKWASANWFEAHELHCDNLLDDFFGSSDTISSHAGNRP